MPNWVENKVEIKGDKSEIERFIEMSKGVDDNGDDGFIFSNYFHLIGLNGVDVVNDVETHRLLVGCNSIGFWIKFDEDTNCLYFSTKWASPYKFFHIFSQFFELSFKITSVEYNMGWSLQSVYKDGIMYQYDDGVFSLYGNEKIFDDDERYHHTYFKDELGDLVTN